MGLQTCNGGIDSAAVLDLVVVPGIQVLLDLQDGEHSVDGQQQHDGSSEGRGSVKELHKQGGHNQNELEPAL